MVRQKYKRHNYTKEETDYIRINYPLVGKICADHIGLSREIVKQWANLHGILMNKRFVWTDEQIEILKRVYPNSSTMTTTKTLGIPRYFVKCKIDRLGLKLLPKNQRLCIDCGINFQSKRAYGFRCKDCFNKRKAKMRREKPSTQRERFNELVQTARYRSKKMGIQSDIDIEYLEELFEKQNKKCYYSGLDMNFERWGSGRKKYSVTIDQIIPSAGYTKGNIVLCTWAANVGKSNFPKEEYIEFCNSVVRYQNEKKKLEVLEEPVLGVDKR